MDSRPIIWLFFGLKGRVSRAAYFLAGLFLAVIQAFLLYRFTLVPQDSTAGQTWALLFWAVWNKIHMEGVDPMRDTFEVLQS